MITKNIYFYSPSISLQRQGKDYLSLNPTPLYLQSYIKRNCPDLLSMINWTKFQFIEKSRDELIDDLENYDIDILCLSLYIWNRDRCLETIQDIKSKVSRPLTIITGGPSSTPQSDQQFLAQNFDIDFAVYGQGEGAFVEILKHICHGKKLNTLESNNLAWKTPDGKIKIGQFNFLKEKNTSPYIESQELLEQMIYDIEYKNHKMLFPYESSRGCQYNCSFCDWTSGLTHKVYHRSFSIEDEIDLLGRLGLYNIYLADANFGQHKQDIEIAKTFVRLKQTKGYDFKILSQNFSKLNKQKVFEILEIFLDAELIVDVKFAVQDTHDHILKNIDRPDIPWIDHRNFIVKSQKKYPKVNHIIELIQGLPGQTRSSWERSLIDIKGFGMYLYPWLILPNSPAGYDLEYQKKMDIKTKVINVISMNYQADCVISTYSYDFDDYMYFTLLSRLTILPWCSYYEDWHDLFDKIAKSRHLNHTLEILKSLTLDLGLTNQDFKKKFNDQLEKFVYQLRNEYQMGAYTNDYLPRRSQC